MGEAKQRSSEIEAFKELDRFQSRFDDLVQPFGAPFKYRGPDTETLARFDWIFKAFDGSIKQAIRDKINIKEPVAIGIIDDASFNAFAAKVEGGYIIGINAGLVYAIHNFSRAVAADTIWNDVPLGVSQQFRFNPFEYVPDITSPISVIPAPLSTARKTLANNLFKSSMHFITAHEFCHISAGHLDWLNATQGMLAIHEDVSLNGSKISGIDFQAMEIFCDYIAFSGTQSNEMKRVEFLPNLPINLQQWANLAPSISNTAATIALFRLFRYDLDNVADIRNLDHPSAPVRFRSLFETTLETFTRRGLRRELFEILMVAPAHATQDSISRLTGDTAETELVGVAGSEPVVGALSELLNHTDHMLQNEWKDHAWIAVEDIPRS